MSEAIIVACITAFSAVIVALVQRSRRENHSDHAVVMNRLEVVAKSVEKVGDKIDRHVEWHMEQSGRD